ncbi:multidrug transporter MatE [Aureimonas ureilytica]|uniref:Multidrug-efflux transporter n=1 Tax=Aureimonas ureilytica TaxID=401562 RepID=A0A175RCH2_9HYPH|nr:MATE family efflux transporter [Aureimonas ureilytica]KTQ97858.1 multidrug transporter MatE [Aureimonas ureilytica]
MPTASSPQPKLLPWRGHLKATFALGLPLVGAQLAQISINVTNTVMIGQLGAAQLAAAVLATQTFYVFWMFGSGFAYAVMPVAAAAHGNGDVRGVRRSVRMGLWVVIIYSLLVMVPLWFTETILVHLGQEPAIAAEAGDYVRVLQWSMAPYLATFVLRSYLSALERPNVVLGITLLGAGLNALFNYILVFGHFGAPALGLTGSGIASVGTSIATFLLLLAYTSRARGLEVFDIWRRFHAPDWPAFREVLRLGWPIGATILAEVGLFTAASVMMGWIGTLELAAHGIALQLASISFMIPLGLASAATVRVGTAFGRHDAANLERAARISLIVAGVISCTAAMLFWVAPGLLIGLYLDMRQPNAQAVLQAAIPLLAVAAAFQIVDSLQVTASGILRGMKDTRIPMFIAVASYWLVGMPVAYGLAFVAGWKGVGVWWGLAGGLLVAAILMSARFVGLERKWRQGATA